MYEVLTFRDEGGRAIRGPQSYAMGIRTSQLHEERCLAQKEGWTCTQPKGHRSHFHRAVSAGDPERYFASWRDVPDDDFFEGLGL